MRILELDFALLLRTHRLSTARMFYITNDERNKKKHTQFSFKINKRNQSFLYEVFEWKFSFYFDRKITRINLTFFIPFLLYGIDWGDIYGAAFICFTYTFRFFDFSHFCFFASFASFAFCFYCFFAILLLFFYFIPKNCASSLCLRNLYAQYPHFPAFPQFYSPFLILLRFS